MFKRLAVKEPSQTQLIDLQKELQDAVGADDISRLDNIYPITKKMKTIIMAHSDNRTCFPVPIISRCLDCFNEWFQGGKLQPAHYFFILSIGCVSYRS